MTRRMRTCGALVLLWILAGGPPAAAQSVVEAPGLIVGGSYAVTAGQTLRGDITAVGAAVVIESGATLEGSLTSLGGSTVVDGTVTGSVHAYGGALTLGDAARVRGDLSTAYAAYEPAPGAVVEGATQAGSEPPLRFSLPEGSQLPADVASRALFRPRPFDGVLRALALGLVAAMLMAAIPLRMGRVRDAMLQHPGRAGLDGFLTSLVALLVLLLVAVTIIGIPLAIIGGMLLYATVLFGWIAFGDAVGSYLADRFKQTWSAPLRAGVGAFSLSLALSILELIPVLGGLIGFALALVALGAVRMTRFGGRPPRLRRGVAPSAQGG